MFKSVKKLNEINWFKSQKFDIVESNKGSLKYIVSGPFARADYPNGNNRIYPKNVLNTAIEKLRPRINNKEINMMVDHPNFIDASQLKTGAILLEISNVKEDGYAYYKAQLIDTRAGKDLKAIVDAGGKLGVSTRGYGLVDYDREIEGFPGKYDIVKDGFELETIDFVDDPSVKDTKSYVQYESQQRSKIMPKNLKEFKEQAEKNLLEEYEKEILAEVKKEHDEQLKEQADKLESTKKLIGHLTDAIKEFCPDVFTVIEDIDLKKVHDKEVKSLQEQLNKKIQENDKLKTDMKTVKQEMNESAKNAEIEKLKAKHAEFFELDIFENIFENCLSKEDVAAVFEKNYKIYKTIQEQETGNKPSKSKVQDLDNSKKPNNNGLTEDRSADLQRINRVRLQDSLEVLSVEQYKAMKAIN